MAPADAAGGTNGYQCLISNACSSVTNSAQVSLTVNPNPTATFTGDASVDDGDSTTIFAVLTGTGPWTVTWSDGTTNVVSGTNVASHTVSPERNTTYSITNLTDAHCAAYASNLTNSATVTVYPPELPEIWHTSLSFNTTNWLTDPDWHCRPGLPAPGLHQSGPCSKLGQQLREH